MNTLLTLGLLCSLAGTSLGLKCWNSDGYKNMRDTNVVSELNCPSDANKSCSKEWYKVVSWGDIYYKLGCSSNDPKAETEEKKGPGGEMGSYFCNGEDFCNSSGSLGPIFGLLAAAILANLMK